MSRDYDDRGFRLVVAGAGTLGIEVAREIRRMGGIETVVVERDPARAELVSFELGEGGEVVVGDALDEDVLIDTGVPDATGLIAALRHDRDNLFLCLAARQLNPGIRVVARVESRANEGKFRSVGVSAVVSLADMGGRRLAHAMLRPALAAFTDALVESEDRPLLIDTLTVARGAPLERQRLGEACIQTRTGCVVLGARSGGRGNFGYRPGRSTRLKAGSTLVALGEVEELEALRALVSAPGDEPP